MTVIASYVAGSVNFPIVLFGLFGKQDPRTGHSGNPGVTNVYRLAGLRWAVAILILDLGRAAGVALAAAWFLNGASVPWAGFALVLGNRFPCFHGFKGGKGVANFLGFTLPVAPLGCLISGVAWLIVKKFTGRPFLGSFAMVLILAAGNILHFDFNPMAVLGTFLTVVFIFHNHKQNVREYLSERKQ